jgi:hypothetical protein
MLPAINKNPSNSSLTSRKILSIDTKQKIGSGLKVNTQTKKAGLIKQSSIATNSTITDQ